VLLCVVNDNNDDNDADGEMMPDGGLSSIGRGLLWSTYLSTKFEVCIASLIPKTGKTTQNHNIVKTYGGDIAV